VGYEQYLVSNLGKVKNNGGQLLKPMISKLGYLYVGLYKDGKRELFMVHQLVAMAFIGPYPEGKEINHENGVKTDCSVDNLKYVTKSENIKHAFATGLKKNKKGSQSCHAKLIDTEVAFIRRAKMSLSKLASLFNVSTRTIGRIKHREVYK